MTDYTKTLWLERVNHIWRSKGKLSSMVTIANRAEKVTVQVSWCLLSKYLGVGSRNEIII